MSTRSTIVDTTLEHWYVELSERFDNPVKGGPEGYATYIDIDNKSLKQCIYENGVWEIVLKDCELSKEIGFDRFKIPHNDICYFEWMTDGPFMAIAPFTLTAHWIQTQVLKK